MATHSYLASLQDGKAVFHLTNIMHRAWQLYRREALIVESMASKGWDAGEFEPFGHFLKQAWADAKAFVADLRMVKAYQRQTPEQRCVTDLEHRTRLGIAGWKELETARAAV